MALFERLAKAASTTAFRLSAAAILLFFLAAGVIAALLFWQTNSVLTDQVLATLRGEAAGPRRSQQQSVRCPGRKARGSTI
jgi:hypothetical protein